MIPKVIHRIWLGGGEPEWTRPFRESWERPGWTVRDWDESSVGRLFPLLNQRVYDDAENIAPNNVGQLRSDLLRYEILHRFGGVYVDHDLECLKPIDPLLEDVECFAAWEIQEEWIANGFMGSTLAHPFLVELIRGIPDNVRRTRGKGFRPNRISGPQYFTKKWNRFGEKVDILPEDLIYPYGWREIREFGADDSDWGDSYTVHHWHNMRREKGVAHCPA